MTYLVRMDLLCENGENTYEPLDQKQMVHIKSLILNLFLFYQFLLTLIHLLQPTLPLVRFQSTHQSQILQHNRRRRMFQ